MKLSEIELDEDAFLRQWKTSLPNMNIKKSLNGFLHLIAITIVSPSEGIFGSLSVPLGQEFYFL